MEIVMIIPGVGFMTASAIMAEIGNIVVFSKPKKRVGWSGLAPGINESTGKSSNGHITKRLEYSARQGIRSTRLRSKLSK